MAVTVLPKAPPTNLGSWIKPVFSFLRKTRPRALFCAELAQRTCAKNLRTQFQKSEAYLLCGRSLAYNSGSCQLGLADIWPRCQRVAHPSPLHKNLTWTQPHVFLFIFLFV